MYLRTNYDNIRILLRQNIKNVELTGLEIKKTTGSLFRANHKNLALN